MEEEILCSDMLFRYFIRKNFSGFKVSNEECDEINIEFSKYLKSICTPQQLSNFVPKNDLEVIWNMDHPLCINGFHPAYMYHFTTFIDIEKKKMLESGEFIKEELTKKIHSENITPFNMMATKAYHENEGDLSKEEPQLCFIYNETPDFWVGCWEIGGVSNIIFPKETTKELNKNE